MESLHPLKMPDPLRLIQPTPDTACTVSSHLHRNSVAAVGDAVVLVEVYQGGVKVGEFMRVQYRIGGDDDAVAGAGLVRGGAVDGDDAGIVRGADGVGGEAFAVVEVVDVDLLVLADARHIQQFTVYRAGAFVF